MGEVGTNRVGCAEFRKLLVSRRGFVQAGAAGTAGFALSDLLRSDARAASTGASSAKRTNNVIILWMRGGPPHIDMWDPKPDAPAEIRGEFTTIPTKVPGIRLTEMLTQSAACMDKWSIIRSLHHNDAGHSSGDQLCFTGYPSGPNPDRNTMPSCGSIVSRQLGNKSPQLPAYVMIPRVVPGADSAFLGVAHRPFETQADPAVNGPFVMPNLSAGEGLSIERLDERGKLMAGFDRLRRDMDSAGQMDAMDEFNRRALGMLTSPAVRDAFDLDKEPAKVRERYGFQAAFDPGASNRCGAPAWSQRILLARRLVEAGVRLVTVDLRWWDTHVAGFESLRLGFLPRWDKAFSALIEDLDSRGLLESTLVIGWGEFGRTPMVNKDAGRDHYPNVFSGVLAGGPVKGGRVVGESDAKGAFPKDNPKTPQDVLATMYRHLGVDTTVQYLDNTGRPHPVLPEGTPISELS